MSWRDDLPIHPAANLFPRMSPAELRELGQDIKKERAHHSDCTQARADARWLSKNLGLPVLEVARG